MSDTTRAALWRAIRAIVVTALVQTFALQVDWTKPDQALKYLGVSLVSGIILGAGKFIRDNYGNTQTTTGILISKMPV